MKRIGIIGDVHAEHLRLSAALEYLGESEVDAVLCTGDLPGRARRFRRLLSVVAAA